MPARTTDTELVARCLQGDEEAWRKLVVRYEGLVWSTAVGVIRARDDLTADVFQRTWTELHRSLARIRDAHALPRWLIVTTQRIARREMELAQRREAEPSVDEVDPKDDPERRFLLLERRQRLEEALRALGGRCETLLRELFLRGDGGKASYARAARKIGVAENSVGPIRRRCLEQMKSLLGEDELA